MQKFSFDIILLTEGEFFNLVLNYPDIYQRKLHPLENETIFRDLLQLDPRLKDEGHKDRNIFSSTKFDKGEVCVYHA